MVYWMIHVIAITFCFPPINSTQGAVPRDSAAFGSPSQPPSRRCNLRFELRNERWEKIGKKKKKWKNGKNEEFIRVHGDFMVMLWGSMRI